ncbi:MAG: peroxiredoxin-like family protein [Burkholderiales bacterium]|nr:peroxiredoxin-like family protein [Burkholderiales bacterium]
MRRSVGETIGDIRLPAVDGTDFGLDRIAGKRFMLSFFRFAACPFCNLRIHELVSRFDEFGDNFSIVAIFDSSPANLRRHAQRHRSPFPILADEHNIYYREYGIERSLAGTLKGAAIHLPSVLHALFVKGYWPTSFGGKLTTMPADFLVDEQRIIRAAHYGRDEADHLPIGTVTNFARAAPIQIR